MKHLAVLLVIFAILGAPVFGGDKLPETALFGLNWGDPIGKDMVVSESQPTPDPDSNEPPTEFYYRPADKLVLEGVPLQGIEYGYDQGRLMGISIRLASARREDLRRALARRWGAPQRREEGGWFWLTSTSMAILRPLPAPDQKTSTLNIFAREDALPLTPPFLSP
jgi:hypothetical protein